MNFLWLTLRVLLGIAMGMFLLSRIASTVFQYPHVASSQNILIEPTPKLEPLQTSVELATVALGLSPTATFPVRNSGNGRLILYRANSECGCVAPDALPIFVHPGETRNLVIELPPDRPVGPWTLTTSFQTNDPSQPMLSLTCSIR